MHCIINNKVAKFYATLFIDNPMYSALYHFRGVFTELKQLGAEPLAEGKLIEKLRQAPTLQNIHPALQ